MEYLKQTIIERSEKRNAWLDSVEDGRDRSQSDEHVASVGENHVVLKVPGFDGVEHEALLDLIDYNEYTWTNGYGQFYAKELYGHIVLAVNQQNEKTGYSPKAVHDLIAKQYGFRCFANGNTLDCRRENLDTDSMLQTAPPTAPSEELEELRGWNEEAAKYLDITLSITEPGEPNA